MVRKTFNRLRSLLGDVESDEAVRQMRQVVKQLGQEERFDLVFFSGKQTFPAIKNLDLPLVVDLCDATSTRIRGRLPYTQRVRRPLLMLDYVQMRTTEQRLIRRASHVLFASSRDREALLNGSDTHATIVPNGVNLDFWRRTSRERGRDTIVFTGGMDYPPNTDAALYLIEEIFPLVQRSVPGARLFIVGRDPSARLVKAGQRPNVTVTGFVEDVRPYLEQATVFAAPLRFGAGIQNKVLEAMAMEVPIVASPLAADGLRTEKGDNPPIQVAQNRETFAQLICHHLAGWASDPNPDREARRFVAQHFVWERSGEKLEQVINRVANGAKEELCLL